jgi:hypothetical protein
MNAKIAIVAALVGIVGAYLDMYVVHPPIGFASCVLIGAMILNKEQNGN